MDDTDFFRQLVTAIDQWCNTFPQSCEAYDALIDELERIQMMRNG